MSDDRHDDLHPRKRRRWGRYVLLLLLLALVVLIAMPAYFTTQSDALIRQRLASYRAAGEPASAADLALPSVPDEENAVLDLRLAAGAVANQTEAYQAYDKGNRGYPLTGKERALLATILQENAAVFDHLDEAMRRDRFEWPARFTSPLVMVLLPDLSSQRALANTVTMAALAHHDAGDDAAALRDVQRLLFIARAMDHHPQCLVVGLVATGMRALAHETLFQIAPDLKIGNGPGPATRPASRQQVDAVLAELLDDAGHADAFRRGYLTERLMSVDTLDAIYHHKLGPGAPAAILGMGNGGSIVFSPVGRYFTGSMIRADVVIMLDAATATANAMRDPSYQTAVKKLAHLGDEVRANPIRHFYASILLPSYERSVRTFYRGQADCHLAAATLALRAYAADHNGALPPTLDALVPAYLPAVPSDPFSPTAGPLHYNPVEPDPRVYSLGDNGTDEGGSDHSARNRPGRWEADDNVIHLRRQPRDLSLLPDELRDDVTPEMIQKKREGKAPDDP